MFTSLWRIGSAILSCCCCSLQLWETNHCWLTEHITTSDGGEPVWERCHSFKKTLFYCEYRDLSGGDRFNQHSLNSFGKGLECNRCEFYTENLVLMPTHRVHFVLLLWSSPRKCNVSAIIVPLFLENACAKWDDCHSERFWLRVSFKYCR